LRRETRRDWSPRRHCHGPHTLATPDAHFRRVARTPHTWPENAACSRALVADQASCDERERVLPLSAPALVESLEKCRGNFYRRAFQQCRDGTQQRVGLAGVPSVPEIPPPLP